MHYMHSLSQDLIPNFKSVSPPKVGSIHSTRKTVLSFTRGLFHSEKRAIKVRSLSKVPHPELLTKNKSFINKYRK